MPLGKPIINPLAELMPEDPHDLTELTPAENLWLWRHRQRATNGRLLGKAGSAMNQDEAARALGISTASYRALELGGSTSLSAVDVRALFAALGPLRPTVGELCITARRRSGMPLSAAVEMAGVSRPHYLKLEREGDPSVVELWESRGYRFKAYQRADSALDEPAATAGNPI